MKDQSLAIRRISVVQEILPPTRLISRKLEYAVRFICGVAFGVLLAVGAAMVWHLSWPIAAAIPLAPPQPRMAIGFGTRF